MAAAGNTPPATLVRPGPGQAGRKGEEGTVTTPPRCVGVVSPERSRLAGSASLNFIHRLAAGAFWRKPPPRQLELVRRRFPGPRGLRLPFFPSGGRGLSDCLTQILGSQLLSRLLQMSGSRDEDTVTGPLGRHVQSNHEDSLTTELSASFKLALPGHPATTADLRHFTTECQEPWKWTVT